jgi:DNA-binding SARP family transcriptional activator
MYEGTGCLTAGAASGAGASDLLAAGRQALHEDGNLQVARGWFDQAFLSAEQAGDHSAMAAAAIGLGGLWVHEHRRAQPWAQTLSRQRQALQLLNPRSDLALQLRTRLSAEADYRTSRPTQVFEVLQEARELGDPQTLAMALSLAHHCVLGPEHGSLRRQLADELLLTAARSQWSSDRLMGLLWRTVDLFLDGSPDAERSFSELSGALEASPHEAIRFVVSAMQVTLAIRAGDFEQAETLAVDCLRRGEACGDVDAPGWYRAQLTTIRWFQGRVGELLAMIQQQAVSPDLAPADNSHFAGLAVMAADQGDHRLAAAALARLGRGDLTRIPQSSTWLMTMHGAVEAAYQLNDVTTAATAARLLLPYAGLPAMGSLAVTCFGSVHHALGLTCLTTGDPDRAVTHLRQAIRQNLALGHWPAACFSRARLAEALSRRSRADEEEAVRELRLAEKEAAEMGMLLPARRSPEPDPVGPRLPEESASVAAESAVSSRIAVAGTAGVTGVPGVAAIVGAAGVAGIGDSASQTGPTQALIRLLGPVDMRVNGVVRMVSGLRRKAVLAELALNAGEVVSTNRLIDVVWGDRAPLTATNTLQSHVSHLRRLLGVKDAIRWQAPGYLLELPGEATDLAIAQRLIRLGTTSTDVNERERHLQAAVSLWRGQSLMDVAGLIRLADQAERLNQLLLQAELALAQTWSDLGLYAQAVESLEALVRDYPLQEQIHAQLMLTLYRAGRQGDALAVYRRLRAALNDELGIEPGRAVRELETRILRQDVD